MPPPGGRDTTRRQAMPRRSAITANPRMSEMQMPGGRGGAPSIMEASGFMGFAGIAEEEEVDTDDWYENKKGHVTLAGAFEGVGVYLTDKGFGTVHKWCNTEMFGALRLIQVHEAQDYPAVILQLTGTDAAGNERDVVFQYELPLNFRFDGDLTRTFSSIEFTNGEYVGFLF